MLLYHFTAIEFLDSILEHGLNRGSVVLLPRTIGINAVWLTTDSHPSGHGLTEERLLTAEEREIMYQVEGTRPPPGARFANKRTIRIAVKIPSNDKALKQWAKWAPKRIEPSWLATLNEGGDGGSPRQARTWWLCFRTIEPHEFVAVEHMKDGLPAGPAATWHEDVRCL